MGAAYEINSKMVEAMKEFLLHCEELTDDDIIAIWNDYASAMDEPGKIIYDMNEFNAFVKESDFTPLELVSFIYGDFDVVDDYFTFDNYYCRLYSYGSVGDAVDSIIDFEALAQHVLRHPDEQTNDIIKDKLAELGLL